jgi:hypothetical protein
VQYEYSIPKGVAQQTDPDSYSWISEDFSECSAICGGGNKSISIINNNNNFCIAVFPTVKTFRICHHPYKFEF